MVYYAPFCERQNETRKRNMNANLFGLIISNAAIIISRGVVGCR